jgi:Na+/H+-dicarboxylate symporter
MPLSVQVMLGAAVGALLGWLFGSQPYFLGMGNESLGTLGMLVIRLLKALAAPLILVAIIDAFVRTNFTWKQGGRLIGICLFNVSVACTIGLILMNLFRPGDLWKNQMGTLMSKVPHQEMKAAEVPVTLDPIQNLASYVPESFVHPFSENKIISIVLAGVLVGAALRLLKQRTPEDPGVQTLVHAANASFRLLVQILEWIVHLAPFAVLGTTAQQVGRSGLGVFTLLAPFVAIILLGLTIHALLYYPLIAWVVGKKTPREYLGGCADAAFTGLSCNSSLATVPVTLKCLTEKLGVSEGSSRLAACVGTNLNNDGITLYEAMAAVFLAQALGGELGLGQQLGIVAASVMAGVGVAGVPEAGLIVLPLVLGSAGLPPQVVEGAIPLILPVDWIIARARTGVNVMSDMVVAVLLDAGEKPEPLLDATLPPSIHPGEIEELQ